MTKTQQGLEKNVADFAKVLRSRVIPRKPSEQASMLISFDLTHQVLTFRAPEVTRRVIYGIYLGFGPDRCLLFSQQCMAASTYSRLYVRFL